MTVAWLAKRWCVVEQDEQQDLFVGDPWHVHMVDINLRLDNPIERTLCGDLLPARPVYRELLRAALPSLCPQCLDQARSHKRGGSNGLATAAALKPAVTAEVGDMLQQIDLYATGQR